VDRRIWVIPAIFFVIALVGESILHDEPDLVILLVALAAGLLGAAAARFAQRRR
jgi:hypothetical protein